MSRSKRAEGNAVEMITRVYTRLWGLLGVGRLLETYKMEKTDLGLWGRTVGRLRKHCEQNDKGKIIARHVQGTHLRRKSQVTLRLLPPSSDNPASQVSRSPDLVRQVWTMSLESAMLSCYPSRPRLIVCKSRKRQWHWPWWETKRWDGFRGRRRFYQVNFETTLGFPKGGSRICLFY